MLKVISFGEVLIDMLSSRIGESGSPGPEQFTRYPGGAPANVAVAVARLGGESYFAGKVGDDYFGRFLLQTLVEHGVRIELTSVSAAGKTAIAFVSLDDSGERAFSFYGANAAHLDFSGDDLPAEAFAQAGIFHFSSNTLTDPAISRTTEKLVEAAREHDCLVSFDINYRSGLWQDPKCAPDAIARIGGRCDMLKASREELVALYGEDRSEAVLAEWLKKGASLIVVTDGGNAIEYRCAEYRGAVTPPRTDVVDTTAAGDAFVGGLLFQVAVAVDGRKQFESLIENKARVDTVLTFAARCGAYAVSRFGAFTSLPTLEAMESASLRR